MAAVKTKSKSKSKAKTTAQKKVTPIPKGYHTATPYIIVDNAAAALDFYRKALGAKELMRIPGPGGKIMHCEFRIGDSIIMMADEHPEMDARAPKSYGGSPISMALYVANVDAQFKQALAAGGKVKRPLSDQFYGDRTGSFTDPFGHTWHIATHVEDVSPTEMQRRMAAMKK
jgi:PhnB protein